MRARCAALIATLGLVLTADVRAQEPRVDSLDASIDAVVTGGFWETGEESGTIRLIVITQGVDHLRSTLYVQWVAKSTEGESRVVRGQAVAAIGDSFTLDAPKFELVNKKWRATIAGVDSHFSPLRRGRWVITFGKPGEARAAEAPTR